MLVAAGRKMEGLTMVTMEDACPNGVQEEAEMTPPGQPATEPPLAKAKLSAQETGGEERRRMSVSYSVSLVT